MRVSRPAPPVAASVGASSRFEEHAFDDGAIVLCIEQLWRYIPFGLCDTNSGLLLVEQIGARPSVIQWCLRVNKRLTFLPARRSSEASLLARFFQTRVDPSLVAGWAWCGRQRDGAGLVEISE